MKPSPRLRRVLEVLRLRRFQREYRAHRDARLRELLEARARGERMASEIVSGMP
jgi:hypothetical protein